MTKQFSPTRLRAARKKDGRRIELAAIAIDRSAQSLSLYERGHVVPPLTILTKLADFYGVQVADFFE